MPRSTNPATKTWTTLAPLGTPRFAASTITLRNGDLLVVGGATATSGGELYTAEVYDPATGSWTPTANTMSSPRGDLPAVAMLPDRDVLVAGGSDTNGTPVASTDIYDPATNNSFSAASSMNQARSVTAAAALPDGRVLVAGGVGLTGQPVDTAELYSPSWSMTANTMSVARAYPNVAVLPDGGVLVIAGASSNFSQTGMTTTNLTDIFDPATGSFSAGPPLAIGRVGSSIVPLSQGRVMLTGREHRAVRERALRWRCPRRVCRTPAGHLRATDERRRVADRAPYRHRLHGPEGHDARRPHARDRDGSTDTGSVTFTVVGTNAVGSGPASAPSNAVTPGPQPVGRAPRLRLVGLRRSSGLAALLSGVRFSVRSNEAVRLHVELLARASSATISRAGNLTLGIENTRMSARRRRLRILPSRLMVGTPALAHVEVVIVATDRAGRRTTIGPGRR